ncbi:MAG: PqqD family protein [Actinomycetia bacterium]|nr:PqqD family protein [Actinomycetes bacterium]
MSVPSQPRRRERVLVERIEDETVLLDLDSGLYFALNEVGARVWELCDGARSVDEIVDVIAGEYDADGATVRTDVVELLAELVDERLLAPN